MVAEVHRLRSRPARLRQDENLRLRQALLPFRDGGDGTQLERTEVRLVVAKALMLVDRETASSNRWAFVMLSPSQNRIVVRHLLAESRQPMVAVDLWAMLFEHLLFDTGEIVLRRDEIAEELGVSSGEVSRIMSELVEFGAISRVRERVAGMRGPGVVRYFMNPNVATHLSGKARDDAQGTAVQLKLV